MPNWSATNYILRGPEKDIRRFCDVVNSCIDNPYLSNLGFGNLWLVNVFHAFGYLNENKYHLRGCIDPNPDSIACFFGPESYDEYPRLEPERISDKEWCIRFSTQTAWDRSEWLDTLFDAHFPECRYAWRSTDEFGNYHKVYHPELLGAPSIEFEAHSPVGTIDDYSFAWGEEDKAAERLSELTGLRFTADEIKRCDETFCKKINDWNDAHEDGEIYVRAWDLVTD